MVIEGRPFLFSVWMTCSSFESPLLSSAQARTVCFFFLQTFLELGLDVNSDIQRAERIDVKFVF